MNIAIIGGGASGMILASKLKDKNVTIFEKNQKLGKKLLITGNGRCNFTSGDFIDLCDIYNNNFAREIYSKYDSNSFIEFFENIGIRAKKEIHKNIIYYYPNSNKATSVYYNLFDKIKNNKVNIIYNTFVKNIKIENNKFRIITDKSDNYLFDKVVISTGGKSYMHTGSDGSGYYLAENLGHSIIKPIPALVPLKSDDKIIKSIKDIRVEAKVTAYIDEGKLSYIHDEKGEVQFTEYGISGIPIFNLSRYVNRYIEKGKEIVLSFSFCDFDSSDIDNNKKELIEYLMERKKKLFYKYNEDFLCGYLPDEIARVIIKFSGDSIEKMAENILDFRIKVTAYSGFEKAQITMGGVDINEVDVNTLMSKIVKNLYFTGEVLDIDGKCGGYNLQLCYSSASIVADSI